MTIKKHLFFINKDLNWGKIPVERQLKYTQNYIIKTSKSIGRLQDWRRVEYNTPSATPEEMLGKAIKVNAIL